MPDCKIYIHPCFYFFSSKAVRILNEIRISNIDAFLPSMKGDLDNDLFCIMIKDVHFREPQPILVVYYPVILMLPVQRLKGQVALSQTRLSKNSSVISWVCPCIHSDTPTTTTITTNPCATNPCMNGGSCFVEQGTAKCSCTAEWSGSICQTLTSSGKTAS